MEKIKLKLSEVYGLNVELKGFTNPQTGELIQKGILDENLPIRTKYSLSKVSAQLVKEIESVEKLREEMIKKLTLYFRVKFLSICSIKFALQPVQDGSFITINKRGFFELI